MLGIEHSFLDSFLAGVSSFLTSYQMLTDRVTIAERLQNSVDEPRECPAMLYPLSRDEVERIVRLARKSSVALYPISRGLNTGYGDRAPWRSGQVVVSLECMNRITGYDAEAGWVEVQPGVTQQALYEFLQSEGGKWFADVTGASPEASVVGNYLDGGFGHTPIGNRREHLLEAEVVLGTGAVIRTGIFPGLGPNLSSLLVQSNFGIVTSIRIPLLRVTPCSETFTLHFRSEDCFVEAMELLRDLRQEGGLPSLVHVANATRTLMSSLGWPEGMPKDRALSEADCLRLLASPFVHTAPWMGIGGLYGSKAQVRLSRRILRRKLRRVAKVTFFSDAKIRFLQRAVRLLFWLDEPQRGKLHESLDSLASLHALSRGVPTPRPSRKVLWKIGRAEDLGLIWISPVLRADSASVARLLSVVRPIFERHGFEMPVTVTLIDQMHAVAILSLTFDRSHLEGSRRAREAHGELLAALKAAGFSLYRKSIIPSDPAIPSARLAAIRDIKRAWDPEGVIAPGRYEI